MYTVVPRLSFFFPFFLCVIDTIVIDRHVLFDTYVRLYSSSQKYYPRYMNNILNIVTTLDYQPSRTTTLSNFVSNAIVKSIQIHRRRKISARTLSQIVVQMCVVKYETLKRLVQYRG